MAVRLGLIGFGTIGRAIGRAVREGAAGDARIVAVLVRDVERHRTDRLDHPWTFTADPDCFFDMEMDLVMGSPKTGRIVAMSAVKAIRNLTASLVVGV